MDEAKEDREMTRTRPEKGSRAGALGERLVYACPLCGVTYDAAPGEDAPECDCNKYSYAIYDGDPNDSGLCAWPSHDGVEIEAESLDAAFATALEIAVREARGCGEYEDGDRLWVSVWDDDGVHTRSLDLE